MYLLYLGILITAAAMLFRFKPTARPALPATDREPPEPVETHPEETGDLGWLPPKSDACDVCFESEGEGKKIRRCSVCKNQFYCSERCQKEDWREHRYNCSELPPQIASSTFPRLETQLETQRLAKLLARWVQAYNECNGDNEKIGNLPESWEILEVYERSPFRAARDKKDFTDSRDKDYRPSLVVICRVFLNHLVQSLPVPGKIALHKALTNIQLPSWAARLYGPKVIRRPRSLSSGEYLMILTVAPVFILDESLEMDESSKKRWMDLSLCSSVLRKRTT